MKEKSLGILGGMGPKATAVFYDMVIDKTLANQDQEHINMVILNHATIPDRTHAILTKTEKSFLEAVEKDFRIFEMAEVDHIAIPCNTSHYFFDQLQTMTSIPIINMAEETILRIRDQYGAQVKVGILATEGTIRMGVYEKFSQKYGLELYVPNERLRRQTMGIIYDQVKANLDTDPKGLEAIVNELIEHESCHCVILACTELSCIQLGPAVAEKCVDAMAVLAERAIILSGKRVKTAPVALK